MKRMGLFMLLENFGRKLVGKSRDNQKLFLYLILVRNTKLTMKLE